MKFRRSHISDDNKASWWYWFEKTDGNNAKCKNCDWIKSRGIAKSTSILRNHLKTYHLEMYKERMEAEARVPQVKTRSPRKKIRKMMNNNEVLEAEQNEGEEQEEFEQSMASTDNEDKLDHDDDSPSKSTSSQHQQFGVIGNEELQLKDELEKNLGLSTDIMSMLANAIEQKSEMDYLANQQKPSSGMANKNGTSKNAFMPNSNPGHSRGISANTRVNLNDILHMGERPIVKMTRVESFSAAHRLHNDQLTARMNRDIFGKCNNGNGHGHNYTWKVVLEGPVDPMTGMVYNLADLKREMGQVLDMVDHKNLDLDVPYFRCNGIVSTTENLAVFLYNLLASKMANPALLKKVVVGETDKNCFSYSGNST